MKWMSFYRNTLIGALALPALLAATAMASAQSDPAASYPSRPIRMIVGFAAGGGNDIFARLIGQKLSELLGQTVVIENRPAAGGRSSAEYVANQPADGYTLLVGASGMMSVAAAVYPNLRYHPTKSFIPLSMIADFPLIMSVPVSNPAKSVSELVAWAKQHPDKANYATTSPAFTITTELLKLKTGMPGVGDSLEEHDRDAVLRGERAMPDRHRGRTAERAVGQGRQGSRLGGHRRDTLA